MGRSKKVILSVLAVALIVCLAISGTYAYLTAKDQVKNTFTVGKIDMTLEETSKDGEKQEDGGYKYKVEPSKSYEKDATVTIAAGSEKSFVFVELDKDCSVVKDATQTFDTYLEFTVETGWTKLSGTDNVWYREYTGSGAATYHFFGKVSTNPDVYGVKSKDFSNDDALALLDLSLTVYTGAIQEVTGATDTVANAWSSLTGGKGTLVPAAD